MFTINLDFDCVYCGSKIQKALKSSHFQKHEVEGFKTGDLTEFFYFDGLEYDNCVRTTCKKCFAFHTIDFCSTISFHACEGIVGEISEYPNNEEIGA